MRERIVSTEKKQEYCEWAERMELYCWAVFYVCFDDEVSEWVMIEAECRTQEWWQWFERIGMFKICDFVPE